MRVTGDSLRIVFSDKKNNRKSDELDRRRDGSWTYERLWENY